MSANSAKSTFSFRSDIVSTDNLKAWLAGTFVVADPDHSHLVRVFGDDSAYDAFEALCSNGVSSVPIYDEDQGEYTGIVDMFDIVTLAERHIEREELTADGGEHLTTIRGHDKFRKPVRKVANISKRNPFRPLPNEVSLEQVCKLLVTKGMHRVLITDDDRKHCHGVLTQSWILEWMYGHLDDLGPAVDQTVEELGFASATSITSVNQNDVAFDGFKTLSQAGHSALCVVDDDGAVVGSLSVGDLKAIHSEEHHADFTPLFGTAGEFLTLCQSKGRNTTASNVTCGTDATLRECITRCHNDHLHRLFVVDADGKAVGVVALREMIGALVPSA